MASTDNVQPSAAIGNTQTLLDMGIQIYECKPKPDIQQKIMQNFPAAKGKVPIFYCMPKMVIDKEIVFIGTFNLDPSPRI
jgi:phosphatidylserine/phosphatidylglycerophosphate/cardiolipin synthase-like enzyme